MYDEAPITIAGHRLTTEQAAVVRMAIETLILVMAQGIRQDEDGVKQALDAAYAEALVEVQRLLTAPPEKRIQ